MRSFSLNQRLTALPPDELGLGLAGTSALKNHVRKCKKQPLNYTNATLQTLNSLGMWNFLLIRSFPTVAKLLQRGAATWTDW